jgi:hypothetical protein
VRKRERVNNVGLAELNGKRVVYKFSKLPGWCVWWEYEIYQSLRDHLPSVKHFAKTYGVVTLPLKVYNYLIVNLMLNKVNDAGKAESDLPNPFTKVTRRTDVLVQKYVTDSVSLADVISADGSQTNAILYCMEVISKWFF